VLDRVLFDPDWLPESIEELVAPLDYPRLEPEPVGGPSFVLRQVTRVGALVESSNVGERTGRFLEDWDRVPACLRPQGTARLAYPTLSRLKSPRRSNVANAPTADPCRVFYKAQTRKSSLKQLPNAWHAVCFGIPKDHLREP
jgi:hypothetical protein